MHRTTSAVAKPTTTTRQSANTAGFDATKCWVDASIAIAPNGVNEVGKTHTFTCTITQFAGTTVGTPAPDNTPCTVTKVSGPGTLGTPNPCLTSGGTGTCTVTSTSATAGVEEVHAATDVSVLGQSLHRTTSAVATPTTTPCQSANTAGFDATKCWVDASFF